MDLTFRSPFSYGISNSGKRLPRNGLLLYLARPNSDEYLIGEDTEIGEDTYIWGYILPDDADIREATGWVNGTANVFYTAAGVPIVALATEIAAAILPANVVFSLVDATTQTGKLAIYTTTTTAATLAKARTILRDESINYLFYGRTAIVYDPQDLTTMYQDASGTLPVYLPGSGQVDPPVGLALDKSGGGYHASQNTTTARPKLSGRYNLLTATEDFTNTAWTKLDSTAVKEDTHCDLFETISNSPHGILCTPLTVGAGVMVNLTAKVKPRGRTRVSFYTGGTGGLVGGIFDLIGDGVLVTPLASATDATILSRTITKDNDGWYILSIIGNRGVNASHTPMLICHADTSNPSTAAPSYIGDPTKGISIMWVDLRVNRGGSSLPAYQRVDSATTYDTVGFPLYLRRDKVDDDLIVQAPAITGVRAWGSIDTVDIAAATISAGAYQPFGTISAGEPTCTQWIAIDGSLTAAEQAALERYVYSKSKLPVGA